MSQNPNLRVSWKTNVALLVLASPSLRPLFSRFVLKHLYEQVSANPAPLAFVLLSRLGWKTDPTFVWYLLDLLSRVPDRVFEDKWVSVALLPLENIPGKTIRERIQISQLVVTKAFGLWTLAGEAAKVPVDYN